MGHRIALIVCALALLCASYASAAVYYINPDPNGCSGAPCSNSNSGLGPGVAWADLTKIGTFSFLPGDTVTLNRGSIFRNPTVNSADMITFASNIGGTPGNPIMLTSYGRGGMPLVSGAHCAGGAGGVCFGQPAVTWTPEATNPSIWSLPWTTYPYGIYVDGQMTGYSVPWASCEFAPCPANMTNPTNTTLWAVGQTPGANATTVNAVSGFGEWFLTLAGGTTATAAPQCSSCTLGSNTGVTGDTGVTWLFEGVSPSVIGPMVPNSANWTGQAIKLWLPGGDDPSKHVIEIVTHPNGVNINANGAEKNNISILGIAFNKLGLNGIRIFSNGTGSTCLGGHTVANNSITQIGGDNVDDGQFAEGVRYSQGAATGCTQRPQILNNIVAWIGNHSGGLGIQAGAGGVVGGNDVSHSSHGGVNLVTIVSNVSNNGIVVTGNKVHDSGQSKNWNSINFPSSNVGIYSQSINNGMFVNNTVWNYADPVCLTAQCDCIQLFSNVGGTVANNTCYGTQNGLYVSNASSGLIVENNLIANLVGGTPGTSSLPGNLNNNCCTVLDNDVWTSAAVSVNYNGVNRTLAQLQALGFEGHGYAQNATFVANAYPFQLNSSSVGYQTADTSLGNGMNIGANQTGGLPALGQ